jgi:hypothetical protein
MATVEYFKDRLAATPLNKKEVLRYMGASGDEALYSLMEKCMSEVEGGLSARVCYDEYALKIENGTVDLGFCRVESRDLAKNLAGCKKAIVFAATVGICVDRLIKKYSLLSPAKALCIGAIGNERVEALCDLFCEDIASKYGKIRPRYSAGYGDLPLLMQKDIFNSLSCTKNIGVSLGDSLLMTPEKSVTAIVGIE